LNKFFKKHKILTLTILSVLSFKSFAYNATFVPTGSMIPTIDEKSLIVVDTHAYGLKIPFTKISITETKSPERNDIAVFRMPIKEGTNYVKRIVAIPGDTLYYNDNDFKVNFKPTDAEKYTKVIIPEDRFFAIGDNINNSYDSRYWGFIPKENFIGKYVGTIVETRKIL